MGGMLKRGVLRIRGLRCASALDAWSGWSTRRRHVQSICAKSLARLQNLAVSRAWSAWWSLRCLMARVRGMAIKMRHRAVLSAYGVWLDAVVESRTAALRAEKAAERSAFHDDLRSAEDLMNKRVMLSSAQRWNQRGLTKCLVSWQSWTLHKVAVRDMLKKVILRIQILRCASAFDRGPGCPLRRQHVLWV